MVTKAKTPSRPPAETPDTPRPLAQTTEERLHNIHALGERVNGYVQFMCQVGSLAGTSAEAKATAVAAFLERLTVLERQLGRIQEDLRLG
jgi:hypothetical protein